MMWALNQLWALARIVNSFEWGSATCGKLPRALRLCAGLATHTTRLQSVKITKANTHHYCNSYLDLIFLKRPLLPQEA